MSSLGTSTSKVKPNGKSRLVWKSPWRLIPSPENQHLYSDTDKSLVEFAEHLKRDGILEPLVITADDYIISGHRRHAAAKIASLDAIPCRVLVFERDELGTNEYVRLVREFNRQRSKTIDEILRETLVDADPDVAYVSLVESRVKRARDREGAFAIDGVKWRSEISANKMPMAKSILRVIDARREYWPLADRAVHYALLSDPPLRHAKKPDSGYQNNRASYQDLCDLLTRLRIKGTIPWRAIDDPTRPAFVWPTHRTVANFVECDLKDLFGGYWRDLLQSQPDHHEIIIEKNTALTPVKNVAMGYTIPVTSGRGQCCKARLQQAAARFWASKKERLILYLLSDFDPSGDAISNATARSMRDDLGINESCIVPVRVALRLDQVETFGLPRSLELKESDVNRQRFIDKHGVEFAVELDAMEPRDLEAELDKAIRSHINVNLFNEEVQREKEEAGKLVGIKGRILEFMRHE